MALGCTLEVAEEYMETVNQSVPVLEAIYGYGCSFGHPLDILKTTAPPPETSTNGYNRHDAAVYSSVRRNVPGSRRSGATTDYKYCSSVLLTMSFSLFCLLHSYSRELFPLLNDIIVLWSVR